MKFTFKCQLSQDARGNEFKDLELIEGEIEAANHSQAKKQAFNLACARREELGQQTGEIIGMGTVHVKYCVPDVEKPYQFELNKLQEMLAEMQEMPPLPVIKSPEYYQMGFDAYRVHEKKIDDLKRHAEIFVLMTAPEEIRAMLETIKKRWGVLNNFKSAREEN